MNLRVLPPSLPSGVALSSRRWLLRRLLLGAVGLPCLGGSPLWSGRLLAATEDSLETEDNWEGPFYKPGAPERSVLLEKGMGGTPLTLSGKVLNIHGRPLKGAVLDIWHADHTGNYDNLGFKLRGKLHTDDEGRYVLRTVKPRGYGPTTDQRPAHIHVKASSGNSPVLTTQLYFKGDPWNRHDPAVRPSLIMTPRREADGLVAQFDFVIRAD